MWTEQERQAQIEAAVTEAGEGVIDFFWEPVSYVIDLTTTALGNCMSLGFVDNNRTNSVYWTSNTISGVFNLDKT